MKRLLVVAALVLAAACGGKVDSPETYAVTCACPAPLQSFSGDSVNPKFSGGLWTLPFKQGDGTFGAPVISQCVCNAIPKALLPAPTVAPTVESTVMFTPMPVPTKVGR